MRLLVLLVVALIGAAAGCPGAEGAPRPRAGASPLPFLRVGSAEGPTMLHRIVDARGRTVLLKGINADGLVDYYRTDLRPPYPSDPASYADGACPPDDPSVEGVALCGFDLGQMRPLGYDVIRLNLSWDLLEPSPGQINKAYMDRIAQVVGWARQAGVYVVLDLHQDAWSKYLYTPPGQSCPTPFQSIPGFDGSPQWASSHLAPVCALNGIRELDPAVQEDFQRFYDDLPAPDGVGLQEHYALVLGALAARFKDEPTVAGYEIMNEPSPGYNAVPGETDATQLFPFYAKVIRTVRGEVLGFRQLFFIEPNAERNVTDQSAILTPWSAYSNYRGVVYAPHVYTGVFTADQELTGQRFFPSDGGYRSAISDAQHLGLPLWIGEFGNSPPDDETLLRNQYELQDRFLLGGTIWIWKEHGSWGVLAGPYGGGTPVPTKIKYTDRAYPLFTAGHLRSFSYDPGAHSFDLRAASARVRPGDRARATVIFVPASARGGRLTVSGARLSLSGRSGALLAYVYPTGGPYRVRLSGG